MIEKYPIIHFKNLGKWYVMIEEWYQSFDVYLKYYMGENYLKVDWTSCKEENKEKTKETLYKQALLHTEEYLEKLVDELQEKISDLEI